jgi:thiosulfate dehydrogenase [quinone] large subunit
MTFIYAGVQHLADPAYFDSSKPGYVGHLISQYAVGSPIHDFLLRIVTPNAVSFGYVVAIGESLIGIAALLGFLFRPAALAGLLLNLTFFFSATWNAFPFYFGSDIVFVMCWLTLLLTGPQAGLSIDSVIAGRSHALQISEFGPPIPEGTRLYPKQVAEVNRAFDRIEQQFVSHEETRTILEFVRVFVLSLGVDRKDAAKILQGLENIIGRNAWEETHT